MSRCKCSHAESIHNRRTGMCWQHPCGCQAFRPPHTEDNMREPDVTRISLGTKTGEVVLIDPEDSSLISGRRWHLMTGRSGNRYAFTSVTGGVVLMHRLLIDAQPGYEVDHVNGDGLDNRRRNLRAATPSQNKANRGKPRLPGGGPSTSIYKGVTWDPTRDRWRATIKVDNRSRNLGRYDDQVAAARAYDSAAIAAWGEFARPNFIVAEQAFDPAVLGAYGLERDSYAADEDGAA